MEIYHLGHGFYNQAATIYDIVIVERRGDDVDIHHIDDVTLHTANLIKESVDAREDVDCEVHVFHQIADMADEAELNRIWASHLFADED